MYSSNTRIVVIHTHMYTYVHTLSSGGLLKPPENYLYVYTLYECMFMCISDTVLVVKYCALNTTGRS